MTLNLTTLGTHEEDNNKSPSILITGGLGFIGSHVAVVFAQQGYQVSIVDNLSNCTIDVLTKLEQLTDKVIRFSPLDITDQDKLEECFEQRGPFDLVVHCAAKKSVPESCSDPFGYYDTNITGTVKLLAVMDKYECRNIMFSSSGSIYDTTKGLPPFVETDLLDSTNPYSNTKLIMERILKDISERKGFNCIIFRYFNPIGAHHSGLIGELPIGTPGNLLPYILNVASGKAGKVSVFGDDYETEDGTGVRDYIHVMDVAQAHLYGFAYIQQFLEASTSSDTKLIQGLYDVFNLGTGEGNSVKQMIDLAEKITEKPIPYTIADRRPGDVALNIANPQKAYKVLSRKAEQTVYQAIEDAWRFASKQEKSE